MYDGVVAEWPAALGGKEDVDNHNIVLGVLIDSADALARIKRSSPSTCRP
jgi:hypothetical protein